MYKLDKLDRQILSILQKDGRASHVNIAKRLGVGHTRVRDRILRMEEAGVIEGYRAVINPAKRQEVQLDEHKLLITYGDPLGQFESALIKADVYPDENIQFITEAEHVHSSSESMYDQFNMLQSRLGVDGEKFAGAW